MADRLSEIRARIESPQTGDLLKGAPEHSDPFRLICEDLPWAVDEIAAERERNQCHVDEIEALRDDANKDVDRIDRLERALEYAREWTDNETWVAMDKIMNEEPKP